MGQPAYLAIPPSPPGAPVDETMMASGVPVVTADDEASNATPAEQAQQQQQERKSSGPVGGFLNWLFGSGEDKKRDAAKSDSDSDNN